jgi:hypothetical protein
MKRLRIRDNNKTVKEFLYFINLTDPNDIVYLGRERDIIIDMNKTLKDYGFDNEERVIVYQEARGGGIVFGDFKDKDNIIISDLIKEKNDNYFKIYNPRDDHFYEFSYGNSIVFELTGSNNGPVFGGKNEKFSLDSNIAKAAVFMGMCQVGQKIRIELKIMKNDSIFEGSTKNEITTSTFRFIDDCCFIIDKIFYEDKHIYYHVIKQGSFF